MFHNGEGQNDENTKGAVLCIYTLFNRAGVSHKHYLASHQLLSLHIEIYYYMGKYCKLITHMCVTFYQCAPCLRATDEVKLYGQTLLKCTVM